MGIRSRHRARPLVVRRLAEALATMLALLVWSGSGRAALAQADSGEGMRDAGVDAAEAAAPASTAEHGAKLRVLVAGTPPFVVIEDGAPSGLSVELWRGVALALGIDYELRQVATVRAALKAIEAGAADVLVGPISVTADRARRVGFSQPYYHSSLAIMAPRAHAGLLGRLAPFFSKAFAVGIVALLSVLAGVGVLLWLAERRHPNTDFPERALPGIGVGIWLALVTMTTVGYGDKVPRTLAGRIVAGAWMVIALISASSLTAGIATTLTLARLDTSAISRARDLEGKRVGTVVGSPARRLILRHGGRVAEYATLAEAADALASDNIDAIVFDRPLLVHFLRDHADRDFAISDATYEPQGYAFAFRHGAKFRDRLDVGLLSAAESGVLEREVENWIGPESNR